ncbi:MAG: hemolysin family protein [Muribaculaceae bacterium]|nr:hemolysin family protein [Muribaculaceae bacterium]
METTTAIIITVIAVILSAIFSGSEIAFVQSSKVKIEIDATRGSLIGRIIKSFSRHEDMFISTLLIGNNVVLVIYGITLSILINPYLGEIFHHNDALMLLCNTIMSTLLILIFGEFLPKTTFRVNPNVVMRVMALPLYVIYIVLYPVSVFVSAISRGMMRLFHIKESESDSKPLTMDQLDDYIEQSIESKSARQVISNEVRIFHNALDFKDTTMSECMIPRNEIAAVSLDNTTREELVKKFIATGMSKIVVYKEDIDDVVGYIHVSELFNQDKDWRDCLNEVIFTPETMLANKMMRRMMAEKRSIVIVVDEFGGTAGLATLEDLVEEIFGDFEDEHDKTGEMAQEVEPGEYLLSGRLEIDDINERFGLDLKESDDYETLAGYLLENIGALPEAGKEYEIQGRLFRVVKMTSTKIELVNVKVPQTSDYDKN